MKTTLKFILALILSLSAFQVSASHLMGGNITYECVGNNTYIVKVELYQDCNGINLGPTAALMFQSATCTGFNLSIPLVANSPEVVTQICSSAPDACNNPLGIYGVNKYTYIDSAVVLGSCSDWKITYDNCCRNSAITTISNQGSFYLYTTLNATTTICNSSPKFDFDPIFYACIGDTAMYSHGVSDLDGDNLVFSLINCLEDAGTSVPYNTGLSGQNPLLTSYLQIDPVTGTVRFIPTVTQVGVICMLVEEYRNGVKISEVMRDIQIATMNCNGNDTPIVSGINGVAGSGGGTGPHSVTLLTGQNTCFTINALDVNSTQTLGIQYTNSLPGATYNVNPTGNTAQITVCWTPTINDIGTYTFSVSVKDDACPVIAKNNQTYIINVQQGAMTIQGVITRSDGLPLSNSKVYVQNNFLGPLDSTSTDASGNYSIITIGTVAVKAVPNASHFDQKTTYYLNSTSYLGATPVSANSQSSVTVDFATLPALVKVNGTVSRHDGLPLNNSWVHLIDTSFNNIDSVQTTAQGSYSFVVLDLSIDYYVKATPSNNHGDQVITYYNGSETIQAADSVPILTTINIANFSTIDTASAIGGKSIGGSVGVGTDNFTPYTDVRLILKDANGNFINDAMTDDNGKFKFYGLSEGSYKIFVDKVGIDNELAPIVTLTANQSSRDSLEFLLHSYYLEMLNPNSTSEVLNVQNFAIYPNPIQTTFTIQYNLLASANVNIDILDVSGRVVKNVKKERQNAGNYQFLEEISKNNFADGIYFIRLNFDNQIITKRVIIKGQ